MAVDLMLPVPWSDLEDERIRHEYPTEGSRLFMRGRTRAQIGHRAKVLGVRVLSKSKRYAVGDHVGNREIIAIGLRDEQNAPCVMTRCQCGSEKLIKECVLRAGNCHTCFKCNVKKASAGNSIRAVAR